MSGLVGLVGLTGVGLPAPLGPPAAGASRAPGATAVADGMPATPAR